ncbi:LL-diaminopimelate aminotransferase [Calderihabitans maritimus]|uniref:Aminotransferase n=1 Tax=Calderihabitans maritimus TaxID=1246530 RepID=A0A1Z5HPS2_9FIRM|nr:LL-diaminopimelate aminotransferase [Calderihabitans maritimus]GAW91532.1 diaminopimelate aminotransferase [Calderihabitans maritimus]
MRLARRLEGLTSAIFSEMDDWRRRVASQGIDVINLSIGSPDQPPPEHIVRVLAEEVTKPGNFGYALTDGIQEFRQAVSQWYERRFGVVVDPSTEVLALMGSQDGLAHIYFAFIDPGDIALIPDPGYPVYTAGILLAGGTKYPLPLLAENNFLPRLDQIPPDVARKAKLMIINYPNNPVAAVADLEFFQEVVDFAKEYDIVVCHDLAYSELAFDGYRPPSFLQVPGAKEVGVEFHSLSKTYNMAGCRIGFVAGNRDVIKALSLIKSNIDFGIFKPIQLAGVSALTGSQEWVKGMVSKYAKRRDVLVDGLREIGWQVPKPKASMFVWAPLPPGFTSSREFAIDLVQKTGVVVVPGIAFGERGEGYVRMALVCEEDRLREAVARIAKAYSF